MRHLEQLKQLEKYGSDKRLAAESWSKPWQTLIATSLSARTRDDTTIPTATALFMRYNTLEKLSKAKLSDIEKIIKKINYHKTKSRHVIDCARMLVKNYRGKIPLDFNELIKLPGVGRKTANVFLAVMGKDTIGIDTHLSYTSQRLGWSKNKKPEKIEEDLKKLFPREYWGKLNYIVVRFGQTYTNRKKKDELLEKIKRMD